MKFLIDYDSDPVGVSQTLGTIRKATVELNGEKTEISAHISILEEEQHQPSTTTTSSNNERRIRRIKAALAEIGGEAEHRVGVLQTLGGTAAGLKKRVAQYLATDLEQIPVGATGEGREEEEQKEGLGQKRGKKYKMIVYTESVTSFFSHSKEDVSNNSSRSQPPSSEAARGSSSEESDTATTVESPVVVAGIKVVDDLSGLIRKKEEQHSSPFSRQNLKRYLRAILEGLQGLQNLKPKGIVHNDVCPETVLFLQWTETKEAKKGSASTDGRRSGAPSESGREEEEVSKIGAIFYDHDVRRIIDAMKGNAEIRRVRYSAPELLKPTREAGGQEASPESDVWAVACCAVEMITRKPVWSEIFDEKEDEEKETENTTSGRGTGNPLAAASDHRALKLKSHITGLKNGEVPKFNTPVKLLEMLLKKMFYITKEGRSKAEDLLEHYSFFDDDYGGLHQAVAEGDIDLVKTLLEQPYSSSGEGSNVGGDGGGGEPDNQVTTTSSTSRVAVDVDALEPKGKTALYIAALCENEEMVRLLHKHGADLDIPKNNSLTPVLVAANYGHAKMVDVLAELGADLYKGDTNGLTVAHYAAVQGHLDVLHLLHSKLNFNLNVQAKTGATPAHFAAADGQVEALKTLRALGANIELLTKQGLAPVSYATRYDQVEVARYFHGLLNSQ